MDNVCSIFLVSLQRALKCHMRSKHDMFVKLCRVLLLLFGRWHVFRIIFVITSRRKFLEHPSCPMCTWTRSTVYAVVLFFFPQCPFFATSLCYRLPLACGESERKKEKRFTSSYIRKTRVNNASETSGNKREVTLTLSPGNELGATNSPIPICAGIMGENKFFFLYYYFRAAAVRY